jgi:hypothetical protein
MAKSNAEKANKQYLVRIGKDGYIMTFDEYVGALGEYKAEPPVMGDYELNVQVGRFTMMKPEVRIELTKRAYGEHMERHRSQSST